MMKKAQKDMLWGAGIAAVALAVMPAWYLKVHDFFKQS